MRTRNYPWHYLGFTVAIVSFAVLFLPVIVARGVWTGVLLGWELLD